VTNKCPPDYDGGYELRAFQIACALRAHGHEVDIATSRLRPGFVLKQDEPPWVHRLFQYVPISTRRGLARRFDAAWKRVACTTIASKNVPAMQRFLDGKSYDIAYCFGLHRISLAVAKPISNRGIPILWHAGGTYIVDQLYRWPKELPGFRLAMALFAKGWYQMEQQVDFSNIAFVSEFLRDYFFDNGMAVSNPYVISRGADFPLQTDVGRVRQEPPMFFMASRVDFEKGIHTAIGAAELLLKRRPELQWSIEIAGNPGDPGYLEKLHETVAAAGLTPRIQFLGKLTRDRVLEKMRVAAAFVSCSRYGEPFAGTIIETLASGTPLLGSIDGSIREVVVHGKSALLFERDDAEMLSRHMEAVLTQPGLCAALSREGLNVIEDKYTLEKIIHQTEIVLARIVERHAQAGAA
jgi:glycosyltransferase involved in cell wall biosynthesis